jgi:hypothetical protein
MKRKKRSILSEGKEYREYPIPEEKVSPQKKNEDRR